MGPSLTGDGTQNVTVDDASNAVVVPFLRRGNNAEPAPAIEPFLTNAERKEIREMLAYYRTERPKYEKLKTACPTARYLLDEE